MSFYMRQRSGQRFLWDHDFLHMHPLTKSIARNAHFVSGAVLDIGCGNKPYLPWFENVSSYTGIDVDNMGTSPDIVASAMQLPFADSSFNTVVSYQTFEHLREPWTAWSEIARVLKPDGVAIVTTHQAWRLHAAPEDYFRFTKYGLISLAERAGLQATNVETHGGVFVLAAQSVLTSFIIYVPRKLRFLTWPFVALYNLCFMILDRIWADYRDTMNYLIVAQK